MKTTSEFSRFGACENILIRGCILRSASCAVKIGSETVDAIRNVIVDSCIISDSNRGIGILSRDGGRISEVSFSNMAIGTRLGHEVWWGKAEAISVTVEARSPGTKPGGIGALRFSGIECRGENGIYVSGLPGSPVESVTMDRVAVTMDKSTDVPGGCYDRRPCAGVGIVRRGNAAFLCEEIRELALRDCTVRWGAERPAYFTHALECRNLGDLRLGGFRGESAHPALLAAQSIFPRPGGSKSDMDAGPD